jgi:ABC-type amino acid transport substrate-binding protein
MKQLPHQSPITQSPNHPITCHPITSHPVTRHRVIASLLLFSLLLFPASAPVQAQSNATRGTVIIAIATDLPPFAAQAANGQVVGFDMDLLNMLVRTAGLRVAYEPVPFIQLIPGVATELYDAAAGCIGVDEERKVLVDFSAPYFTTGAVLVVSQNNPPLYDLTDLTPAMTISTIAESQTEALLRAHNVATVVTVATMAEALELAAAQVTTAALADEISAERFMRSHPEVGLHSVSGLVAPGSCAIAVSKGNPRLLLELNAALTRLKNNGKYLAIYRRWFGNRPLTGPRPAVRPTPIVASTQLTATVAATLAVTTTTGAESPLAAAAMGAYAVTLLTEPPAYQILELAPAGAWLKSPPLADEEPLRGLNTLSSGQLPVQQGRWQALPADPLAQRIAISATVPFSVTAPTGTPSDSAILPQSSRKEYQLTIGDDGALQGTYILYTSAPPTATVAVTATMNSTATGWISETVELIGQRIVE